MDDKTRLELAATFDAVADGYDARPPYPDAIFTLLAERCGCGAGTRATYSPWLALPEKQRTATLDALERVAREEFDDQVVRPYLTSLFLAQRAGGR